LRAFPPCPCNPSISTRARWVHGTGTCAREGWGWVIPSSSSGSSTAAVLRPFPCARWQASTKSFPVRVSLDTAAAASLPQLPGPIPPPPCPSSDPTTESTSAGRAKTRSTRKDVALQRGNHPVVGRFAPNCTGRLDGQKGGETTVRCRNVDGAGDG
jgi:hypothetical protein